MADFDESLHLWLNAMIGVKKIAAPKKSMAATPITTKLVVKDRQHDMSHTRLKGISNELEVNNNACMDNSTLRKLQQGKYEIDITLDLHGMNRHVAFLATSQLVKLAFQQRKRLLLLIVGKGKEHKSEPGVLRELVPQWLNSPELRPMIVAIKTAHKRHGGNGAFYILLRRIRDDSHHKTKQTSKTYKN